MRKILVSIIALFIFFCLTPSFQGTAEAARVAILPLQVEDTKTERAGDFTSLYWDIMINEFQYPDYELMDDEKVAAVLPEEGLKSFDKESLSKVLKDTNADIVVAMRLDKLEEESDYFRSEPVVHFRMNGEYAAYNRLTGKYYNKKFHEKYDIEDELTLKNDWQLITFTDLTKRYVYRSKKADKTRQSN